MSKQIMVLGEINTSDVCSVLASAGYQICDSLSVDALKKSQCLVVSASGFEKMNQIIERIRLQVALPIVMVYQELSFEDKKKTCGKWRCWVCAEAIYRWNFTRRNWFRANTQ